MRPADLTLIASTRAGLASGDSRTARKRAGVTQAEMASAVGVTRQAVGSWEAGHCVPGTAHALAYGRLLRDLARRAA